MKNSILFFLGFLSFVYSNAHEIHISITNIDIYNDSTLLAVRISSADLMYLIAEKSVNDNQDYDHNLELNLNNQQISIVFDYIISNLKLSFDKREIPIIRRNFKQEYDHCWFYLKNDESNANKEIKITNRLFIEYNNFQKNLVVLKIKDNEKGFEFNNNTVTKTVSL